MKKNNCYEVSVVIPCYNAEKYIEKTLDSICNQTFKNYEIICVNDGSTDGTLDILNKYKKKYKNFSVISKENDHGKTTIRKGLEKVRGKYVCVIDNDDYVSNDYIKELYNTITRENADIAVCGFQRENYETGKVISKEMNKKRKSIIISEDYGELLEVNTSLWNKMFKANIITAIVSEDILFGMDMVYLAYIYPMVEKISFNDRILYYYQVRGQSCINNINKEYVKCVYDSLLAIKKHYEHINCKMIEFLSAYAFLHIGVSLMYRMIQSSDYQSMYKENIEFLNKYFPMWLDNEYCSFKYVLSYNFRNFKLYICKIFYKIGLFKFFLRTYSFVTNKLKIDIKW